ncbi:PTS sugar transporter subunit IIB [Lactobacillus sp. ESL0791]|uniref:PTS system mannose/fructose/N-acetylgalactosamine-transporter subunit IIB n=1 Tax=Lactobacillus sp. ESL0791 TaxID=2983234 RepID=UPI0023F82035|nr:PTS sugar transporter subunit IIB [Lactobacillus sp. ESL0791]MDF7639465.1 PTS sugar transporter subunit IIB [Lactobacillus sp. ESL0791]
MSEIVLSRIDDRLIHGQVMTAWVKVTHANCIIVIDDGVANDDFMSEVIKMSAPNGIKVFVFNVETAIKKLQGTLENDGKNDKIVLLAKNPFTFEKMIDAGVQLKKIILGGMGARKDRDVLYRNISATEQEKEALRKIQSSGVEVKIHIIPDQKEIDISKLL